MNEELKLDNVNYISDIVNVNIRKEYKNKIKLKK